MYYVRVEHDSTGRAHRSISWGFDGKLIGSQINYDQQGRVFETYQPRFINNMVNDDVANGATLIVRNEYDDLGRVHTSYVLDEAGLKANTTNYSTYQTVLTNVKGQSKTDIKDPWGRLTSTVDANG